MEKKILSPWKRVQQNQGYDASRNEILTKIKRKIILISLNVNFNHHLQLHERYIFNIYIYLY